VQLAAEEAAEDATDQARSANDRSDDYLLMTILFATVLFFAGISSKMDTLKARVLLLSVGGVIMAVSAVIVLSLPKLYRHDGDCPCRSSPGPRRRPPHEPLHSARWSSPSLRCSSP
jgi:hypothetical protein